MIEDDCFYAICADMAKDGSAETAVGVAKVIPKEHYFTYKFINLFTIPSTDYMEVANISEDCARLGLHILNYIGVIEKVGKQGRKYLYKIP